MYLYITYSGKPVSWDNNATEYLILIPSKIPYKFYKYYRVQSTYTYNPFLKQQLTYYSVFPVGTDLYPDGVYYNTVLYCTAPYHTVIHRLASIPPSVSVVGDVSPHLPPLLSA